MTLYVGIKNLAAPPQFQDEEQDRIALILNIIAIATMMGLSGLIIYRLFTSYLRDVLPIFIMCCIVFVSIVLLHRKQLSWSGTILLWCMLGIIDYLAWMYNGLHDIVLFSIPGILVAAGLVLNRRYYLIVTCAALLSIGILGYLEITGAIQNAYSVYTNWNDVVDLEVMVGLTAITTWFLSDNLRRNMIRLQNDEREIHNQSDQLRASEKRYHALFEGANDVIFILSNDKFIECNSMALKMFRCERPTDIIDHFVCEFSPTDQPDNRNSKEKALEIIDVALGGTSQRFYWKFSRKDGTLFDAEVSLNRLEFGNKIYLQALVSDITERLQAEETLHTSDEKLRNIVENSTNLFYSCNTDLVFTYLSSQANDIFECEPDEPLIRFADFITDNPVNKLGYENAKKAIQTCERQPAYELELLSRKGSRVWLEIQEAPVVKEGKTISLVGVATDITKRQRAERALQVSEKKYRDIVTWAPIGIYQSTRSGKLLSANSSIAQMLGYDSENEFVGCNMGEAIYFDTKDREQIIFQHDMAGHNVAMSNETRWKKKDGSTIWVLMTVHDVRDKTGQILYYEGFVFDITERKHAEESLREGEERYRLLVENSTDLVTEISSEGTFLYVSPNVKSILDFRPVDMVGTNVLSKVYSKDKALIAEILNQQGGSAMYRYRDRMGGWHWFESSGRVYDTSSGERRMVMVSRDITERRKAEQELETSRKQLQHFTEHLEHVLEEERKRISRELHDDLGQLLTILKFDLSWLRLEGAKGDSEVIAKTDEMMESLNEALASVKRISKEIRPPQLDALGLGGALQWDIDQMEKKIGIKGVVTIEPAEFEVKGQIGAVLYRIFREALTNVVRHAQAQNVFVRLSKKFDSVVFSIRDDGRGITKKELAGDTSLGLVGIRERIRMVGGTLIVDGKPGQGTMLSVEVPLSKENNGESKS
ncbi:MAG: PAS domain S-box protein [Bacteroidota bacterium]